MMMSMKLGKFVFNSAQKYSKAFRVPVLHELKWRATQGTSFPHIQFTVECVPHLSFLKGRKATVRGTDLNTILVS